MAEDIKLSGTMGGNTTPTGVNIAYASVEDLEQFIQFDRKAEGNLERINDIKKTILDRGYLYDTAYEGGVVFGVIVDEAGNVQIPEGNHRLQALIDVAKETGQEIYVPINPMLTNTSGGNKVQLTNSDNAYNSMKQLLTDMLEGNKNFNVERTISEKLGEPGTRIIGLESYTYPGGEPGTSTNQSNIKKFFNSIGLNTITYDELPENNIYKTGINTFIDTPTNKDEVTEQLSKQVDNIAEKSNVPDQPIMYHGSADPNVRMIPITEASKDAGKYLHTGTYKAAVDRRSGAFADQSIWNLGNSLNSYFEDQVGFNGPLREHFDDLIEQGVQPNEMPSYTNTVEYSIVTDKQYVSQAHIVAEIDEDYRINVRLDWTENVNTPIRKTVDPSFAEVLYDDLTFEYDNYSTRPLNWTAHIQQSVPDPFSISFAYEVKPKENAVIEVLDQGYIILSMKNKNYEPIIGTADTIINEYEVLQRQLPNSRIDWNDFDLVLSGNLNDVVRFYNDGTDTDAFSKLKQTSRPDFMNKLLSADILGYINDVEDPGSISYAVKNREAVDITRLNEQDTAQFQIDVDNRSMEMNTKPYNLFDETGELIEYSDDAMRSYRNGITSQFNRSSVQTPKQYTDQRTANYINNLRQQLPDVPGPGTGMGPGAALANNTAEFVNQLPIEQTLKDKTIERIGKHTAGLAAKAATPDPLQALDIYEDFVMLAGLAYAFAPDIDTFVKNQANNMLETMAGAAGYKVKLQDFEYDWERVSDTMDWVESVSPTDIVIKKVGEVATGAAETGMVTGFGYIPKDLSSTLGNTLTTATTTKEKERDPMYDRIKRTFSGQY